MKKILVNLTRLTAVIIVASIVISCNKTQSPAAASSAPVDKTGMIVFVNSDSLLNNYQYFKDVKKGFEEKSKKAQADLSSKGQAFQREIAEYQQNANKMSANDRVATEERLARKQQELSAYNQNASGALTAEESAENEKLYNKVSEYLKVYAKEKGYKYVLTFSKTNPALLYADSTLEITKEVVDGLNAKYKTEKK
ncbi:MAG TPA: outer membrane chaperone Skp [Sphingobacteriaceae bacterium]|nr:outer membrane chaperone Skp [Sphingobacteriaceae bacterium]